MSMGHTQKKRFIDKEFIKSHTLPLSRILKHLEFTYPPPHTPCPLQSPPVSGRHLWMTPIEFLQENLNMEQNLN